MWPGRRRDSDAAGRQREANIHMSASNELRAAEMLANASRTETTLRALPEELHPSIELTGTRYADPDTGAYGAPDLYSEIADYRSAAGLVVGNSIARWREVAFAELNVELRIDGGPPAKNLFGDWRVEPLEVLVWTANSLSARGIGLAAGSYVSTGSATEPQPFPAGGTATAVFEGLTELRVTLKGVTS